MLLWLPVVWHVLLVSLLIESCLSDDRSASVLLCLVDHMRAHIHLVGGGGASLQAFFLSCVAMCVDVQVHAYEQEIGGYLYERLSSLNKMTIYGPPPTAKRGRASLASFNVGNLHATDISTLLDNAGVAVRSGHHCTQPLHRYLGINASARASLYIYNTKSEVDVFIDALKDTIDFFTEMGL